MIGSSQFTAGESDMLEFKKSTAEKDRTYRMLCAFADGQVGRVLFGVTPTGKAVGQLVSDRTPEELVQEFQNFEPPPFSTVERVPVNALANTFVHRDYGIGGLRFGLTPKYRATASGLTRIGRVAY